jgi:hypothetical protein
VFLPVAGNRSTGYRLKPIFPYVISLFYFRRMKRFGKSVLWVMICVSTLFTMHLHAQEPKPKTVQAQKAGPKASPTPTVVKYAKDSLAGKLASGPSKPDAISLLKDSALIAEVNPWQLFTPISGNTLHDAWLINKPVNRPSTDYIFYILATMILIIGFIRFLFPKYFSDLFGLFFRVTFKQKAIRERLLESTLPSLMLNAMFFISGGFFLHALSGYYKWHTQGNFWTGFAFWTGLLIATYGLKWLMLKTMGWLFQMQETCNTYTFIVFLVNKILGVLLLPVVVLMTLGPNTLHPVLVTIILFLLATLFIYRYIISYPSIKASVRVNQFHFFLYLCAFEIVPLLLIYKGLALQLSNAT